MIPGHSTLIPSCPFNASQGLLSLSCKAVITNMRDFFGVLTARKNTIYCETRVQPACRLEKLHRSFTQLRADEITSEGVRASGQPQHSSGSIPNPLPSPSLGDAALHFCLTVFLGGSFLSSQASAVLLLGT